MNLIRGYTTNNEEQFQEIIGKAIDKTQFADVTTPGADVEFSIEHGLRVIPVGFIPILQDKAASFYLSTTARDEERIYLKCSAATVVARILIF